MLGDDVEKYGPDIPSLIDHKPNALFQKPLF